MLFFKQLLLAVSAVASTWGVFLIHLGGADEDLGLPATACVLDSQEKALIQAQFALFKNASCTFKLAVGPGGVEMLGNDY